MTNDTQQPTPFEKFHATLRKIVSVPKAEIERREKEYQKARKERKQKK